MILSFSLVFVFLVSEIVLSVIFPNFMNKKRFYGQFQMLLLIIIIIEIFASKALYVP